MSLSNPSHNSGLLLLIRLGQPSRFLEYTFHFRLALYLQKSCKGSTKSSQRPLTQFLLLLTFFLCHIHLSKLKTTSGLLQLTKLRALFEFQQFFHSCLLSAPGSNPGYHITSASPAVFTISRTHVRPLDASPQIRQGSVSVCV